MKVLVVGGAGYIGSHMAKWLTKSGHDVVILDNLSTGHRRLACYGKLLIGDLADINFLEKVFHEEKFDAVIHFAAASLVSESVDNPSKYYRNNVSNTINLLDVMVRNSVWSLVFSSTAATFGEPEYVPIDEEHPQAPINPYGRSKLIVEQMLRDYASAYGVKSVALRYFNAAGADPEADIGEVHDPETHLIPLVLQAASGRRKQVTIFGRDYPTPDGTCIRDYVHILDLCAAHELALSYINSQDRGFFDAFNLGNGGGFSVLEVIETAQEVVKEDGCKIKVQEGSRRPGDPAVLVADSTKAEKILGWKPMYPDLSTIISHAWRWEKKEAGLFHVNSGSKGSE